MHSCRLSSTVGTKKSEDFSSPHGERNIIHSSEGTKRLDEMLHLYHVFLSDRHCLAMLNGGWIEDVGKTLQNSVGRVDALQMSLMEERHSFALAHLVEIGR